jgi:hypothetical protein
VSASSSYGPGKPHLAEKFVVGSVRYYDDACKPEHDPASEKIQYIVG